MPGPWLLEPDCNVGWIAAPLFHSGVASGLCMVGPVARQRHGSLVKETGRPPCPRARPDESVGTRHTGTTSASTPDARANGMLKSARVYLALLPMSCSSSGYDPLMATGWASYLGQDVESRTWDACLKMLLSLGDEDVLYRGHACYDWNLSTTLERALEENSKRFDERKYELMHSMAADSETENWASDVENVLMLRFRQQALSFGTVCRAGTDRRCRRLSTDQQGMPTQGNAGSSMGAGQSVPPV